MKGGSSPSKLLDKDELKVDLDSFSHHGKKLRKLTNPRTFLQCVLTFIDLSNDSYSTVNMGLDDGASPHSGGRGSYIHSSGSPPPFLSNSPNPLSQNPFSYSDNIVYTPLGESSDDDD
jgi:LIM homeobox protein 3/4